MTTDYSLFLNMFGEISFIKLFVVGLVIMAVFMGFWFLMSTDAKKIIFAIFAMIGLGFLLGGLVDRFGDKK